jgi:antibiotic biosynthesis monooxygenase (ABM) superfamily enzyme
MLSRELVQGTFGTIMECPPLETGTEDAFLEWFRKTCEVYARHPGFVARYLLKPETADETYRMLVFHQSKATFMAMHTSPDRAEAWNAVEPLLEGKLRPRFFTVAGKEPFI